MISQQTAVTELTRATSARQRRAYACFAVICLLGSAWVRSPALQGRLLADDWDHYAMSVGIYPTPRNPFDHFNFVGRDPADRQALLASGRLPWWSAADLHIAMLRPLASVLGELDFTLLGAAQQPSRMHAHSLGWWLLLLSGVALLLPRYLPLPAAGLALLLYAFEDAAILPVTWAANRSELIANVCIVFALYLQSRGQRIAYLALAGCALLAGEHALPAFGYLVALELYRGHDRLRRLAPLAVMVIAYYALRSVLGYGASGLGMYVDPIATPLRYLRAAWERLPLLFGDVVFGIAADWYPGGPPTRPLLFGLPLLPADLSWAPLQRALGFGACGLIGAALIGMWLRRRRGPVFCLLLGAAIALLPMAASIPMGRLTLPAALGMDAAFGALACALWWRAAGRPGRLLLAAAVSCSIVWVHGVSAGLRSLREPSFYTLVSRIEEDWGSIAHLDIAGHEVVMVSAGFATHWVVPYVRHLRGLPPPIACHTLSAAFLSPHELTRVADNILDVRLPHRPIGATFAASVYRAEDRPFATGDKLSTPAFDVQVLAADGGEPTWLRFSFPRSLDDDRYRFVYPFRVGVSRISLPTVGQHTTLPPPAFPHP